MHTTTIGLSIEALVCRFLESTGLRYVRKNYHCRLGEIDLVMYDETSDSLVFVEVRFRANTQLGDATESVDRSKQKKLKRAVLHYLQKHASSNQVARIDVIGVGIPTGIDTELALPQASGISVHHYEGYQLHWTRSAIED